MSGADAEIEALLRRVVREALGAEVAACEPIGEHLGLRRFFRLRLCGPGPASAVARIEAPEDPESRPPGVAPEPPLEPTRAFLERAGLPVPARLGADAAAGVELLEDLGSRSLADVAPGAPPAERDALYAEACGLVSRLQTLRDPGGVVAFQRRLDAPLFAFKAELFARWSIASRGRAATPAERRLVGDAFALVAHRCESAPARLAHRDFQSANLLVRPGSPRLAMIDLQGAFLAPPEYDLVCLLRDSYVALDASELSRHLEATRPRLPDDPDPDVFAERFDLLTLTRKAKDHARFLQAARTRDAAGYLRFLPLTLGYLREAAARAAEREPQLARFAALVAELPESPCAA
jgi:aminoglycoside/choline kinase family phosphotransferase